MLNISTNSSVSLTVSILSDRGWGTEQAWAAELLADTRLREQL